MIVLSANNLKLLCVLSGMSLIYTRKRHGARIEPWDTPYKTGQASHCSLYRSTHLDLPERNDWIHVITRSMKFQQASLMINFTKSLAEMHDYDISLTTLIEIVKQVLRKLD